MKTMKILLGCLALSAALGAADIVESVAGGGPGTTPTPVPSYAYLSYCPQTIGGIEFPGDGTMIFADRGAGRVEQMDLGTGALTHLVGTNINGYPAPADGDAAAGITLMYIMQMRREPVSGDLYIVEADRHQIYRMDWSSQKVYKLLLTDAYCINIQPLSNGDFYYTLAGRNQVFFYSAATGLTSTAAGSGAYGYGGEDGPAASAQFASPTALVMDDAGDLYVGDYGRIVKITGGNVVRVAGNAGGAYTADGPALSTGFSRVDGIDVNAEGDVFFTADARVRELNAASGAVRTLGGTGTEGWTGDGGDALLANMRPLDIRQGPDGAVYFGNQYGEGTSACGGVRRIRLATPTPTAVTTPGTVADGVLKVFPQPSRGSVLHIQFRLPAQKTVEIKIFSSGGTLLLSQFVDGHAGTNTVDVDVRSFAPGVYLVRVDENGSVFLGPKTVAVTP